MKRAVITGMGIISSIGNTIPEVTNSLRYGLSGISFNPVFKEIGLDCHLHAIPKNLDLDTVLQEKREAKMPHSAKLVHLSTTQAIADANLEPSQIQHPKTGIVVSSSIESAENISKIQKKFEADPSRMNPFELTRNMSSNASGWVGTLLGIQGLNYSVTSACSTTANCVGHASDLIKWGKQNIVIAGGSDVCTPYTASLFHAMRALSKNFNDTPEKASRPFDVDRCGFVQATGGGVVIVEEYEHAKKRGAKIYAEITGYGSSSDGHDIFQPLSSGIKRCINTCLESVDSKIDYINAHAAGTQIGDVEEISAFRDIFSTGKDSPKISSTKSLSGHSIGSAGIHELIFSLIMLDNRFISASANIDNLEPKVADMNIVQELQENKNIKQILSTNSGLGGTNACIAAKLV